MLLVCADFVAIERKYPMNTPTTLPAARVIYIGGRRVTISFASVSNPTARKSIESILLQHGFAPQFMSKLAILQQI